MDTQELFQELTDFLARQMEALTFPHVFRKESLEVVHSIFGEENLSEDVCMMPKRHVNRGWLASLIANYLADKNIPYDMTIDDEGIGVLFFNGRMPCYLVAGRTTKPREWWISIFITPF